MSDSEGQADEVNDDKWNSTATESPESVDCTSCQEGYYDAFISATSTVLLILSPPVVFVGVILLSLGAILTSYHILLTGLSVIIFGALCGLVTAFFFLRLRGRHDILNQRGDGSRRPTVSSQYKRVQEENLNDWICPEEDETKFEVTDMASTVVTLVNIDRDNEGHV